MKKIIVACALLVLAFGMYQLANAKRGRGGSSPIIVSDGSIDIKHFRGGFGFSAVSPKRASVKMANYRPYFIGYQCTLDSNFSPICMPPPSKPSSCTPNSPTALCTVDVNGVTDWTLLLCENQSTCTAQNYTVQIKWNNSQFDITSKAQDFKLSPFNLPPKSHRLHHSSGNNSHLQSASLTVSGSPVPYVFACQQNADCLTIDYEYK